MLHVSTVNCIIKEWHLNTKNFWLTGSIKELNIFCYIVTKLVQNIIRMPSKNVSLQRTFPCCSKIAFGTLKGLLSCMPSHVTHQSYFLRKWILAVAATVGFLSCMNQHVGFKIPFVICGIRALSAMVHFGRPFFDKEILKADWRHLWENGAVFSTDTTYIMLMAFQIIYSII